MKRFLLGLLTLLCVEMTARGQGFFTTGFWQPQIGMKFSTGAFTLTASTCSGAIAVNTYNVSLVAAYAVQASTVVNLTSTGSATFYSDPGCTQAITSVTVLATTTGSPSFYVRDPVVESFNLTASATGYLPVSVTANASSTNNFIWKGTTSSNWATGSNWSGGVVPSTSDVAVFDNTCTNCNPTFTGAIDVKGIRLESNYTGTFAQGAYDITVRAGGLVVNGGTFTGATSALYAINVINGIVTIAGGTFTAPVGNLVVNGGFRVYGSPTVTIPAGSTLDMECASVSYNVCANTTTIVQTGSVTLQNLTLHGHSTNWQLANNITMSGSLTFGDNTSISSGKITGGNIYVYGTAITQDNLGMYGTTAFIVAKGNASGTTISGTSGGIMPPLQIDSGILDVTLGTNVRTIGYNLTSVGTLTTTGSTLSILCLNSAHTYCFGQTVILNFGTALQTYNNVTISGDSTFYDFGGSTAVVQGTLMIGDSASSSKTFSNGAIYAYGDVTLIANGYRATTTLDIFVKGNVSGQTITGLTGLYFPGLTIDSGTNAVTLSGQILVTRYTMTSVGTFNVAGSTLDFDCLSGASGCYGTSEVLNLGTVTYNNLTLHGYSTSIDLGGSSATVTGLLTFGDINGVSKTISNGTINANGNVVQDHNGNSGTGVIRIAGNAAGQTITGVSGMDWPSVNIDAGANTVNVSGSIRTQGWTVTSVGTFNAGTSTLEIYCGSSWPGCYNTTVSLSFGGLTYNNLYFHGYVTTYDLSGSTANVTGLLRFGDKNSSSRLISNGTINAYADVTVDNGGYMGTANTVLKGNVAGQTLTGLAGKYLPSPVIDAGTHNVTLSGSIRSDAWTYLSGTVTTTGSTVDIVCNNSAAGSPNCYSVTATVRPGPIVYNMFNLRGYRTTWDLGGDTLTTSGMLTIGDQNILKGINNGGLSIAGGLIDSGVGNNGTATVRFTGSGTQQVSTSALPIPAGGTTVASTGAGSVTLLSNFNAGSTLTVSSGLLDMAGLTLTVPGALTINSGATLTKNTGTLTYGSLVNNGTLNP